MYPFVNGDTTANDQPHQELYWRLIGAGALNSIFNQGAQAQSSSKTNWTGCTARHRKIY